MIYNCAGRLADKFRLDSFLAAREGPALYITTNAADARKALIQLIPAARAIPLFVALAIGCFGASSSVHVETIRFASYADHTLVYIVSDKTVHYRTARLSDPNRIYCDILNATIGRKLTARKIAVADQLLRYVRVGRPGWRRTRVVLDLNTGVSERVIRLKNPPGLLVNIEKPTSAAKISADKL